MPSGRRVFAATCLNTLARKTSFAAGCCGRLNHSLAIDNLEQGCDWVLHHNFGSGSICSPTAMAAAGWTLTSINDYRCQTDNFGPWCGGTCNGKFFESCCLLPLCLLNARCFGFFGACRLWLHACAVFFHVDTFLRACLSTVCVGGRQGLVRAAGRIFRRAPGHGTLAWWLCLPRDRDSVSLLRTVQLYPPPSRPVECCCRSFLVETKKYVQLSSSSRLMQVLR